MSDKCVQGGCEGGCNTRVSGEEGVTHTCAKGSGVDTRVFKEGTRVGGLCVTHACAMGRESEGSTSERAREGGVCKKEACECASVQGLSV